jgi:hypothetical protein
MSALEPTLRFAFAIVLDALAFVVWDVGTRPPLRLATDVAAGLQRPAVAARGLVRFVLGLGLLLIAGFVAKPATPDLRTFTVLETGMIVAALLVEMLVGNDLRRPFDKLRMTR